MKTSYPLFKNLELNLEYETVNTAKQGPTPVPLIIHYDEIYNSPPPLFLSLPVFYSLYALVSSTFYAVLVSLHRFLIPGVSLTL